MRKSIPIGYEDFREVVSRDLYYVDKSIMVKDIIDIGAKVTLFTRPRRFGKTLNLSMIRRFFEDERNAKGEKIDNERLFDYLAISKAGEKYMAMQQSCPVINLSLKSAKQPDFEMAYDNLVYEISKEYRRHQYILQGEMVSEKESFLRIMSRKAEPAEYGRALEILSRCLSEYHGTQTIILIDEYDVPLENSYFCGFYDQMISFIRSLFESALKTNENLKFGIITGCLRISKESIFTGLNNLYIQSLLGEDFADSFGFTQEEVDQMLQYYELTDKRQIMKDWYDGYLIGDREIYNPWSILNYLKAASINPDTLMQPYWANTSSNSIIRELVENADANTKDAIEGLIEGKTIEKPVHEDITYEDIHKSEDNLWNFLFFTGYLKQRGQSQQGEDVYLKLAIPNKEISSIYRNVVMSWFDGKTKNSDRRALFTAITEGDTSAMEDILSAHLRETISFFDYGENYYHGFLAGLLKGMPNHLVNSNRESGEGRADLILKENRFRGRAFIMELKVTKDITKMEECCRNALEQIDEKDYDSQLKAEGISRIDKYGICFFRKGCMVMKEAMHSNN